jgi:hypothetical protein
MRQSFIFSPSYSTSSALHLAISAFQSALSHNDSVLVFDEGHWEPDNDLYASIQKASWDDVVLDAGLAARVQAEYTSFLRSEEVYKGMGVPWKRGLMFLGVSTVSVAGTEKAEGNRGGGRLMFRLTCLPFSLSVRCFLSHPWHQRSSLLFRLRSSLVAAWERQDHLDQSYHEEQWCSIALCKIVRS